MIKRALLSVSDKTGIIDFARELTNLGVEILSTGGTFKVISDAGISVKKVEDVTHFPEILNGRVKTLHPNIHAGILACRDEDHLAQLDEHKIGQIDLVVVNLYPFESTIAREDVTSDLAIENIDIGGPTMLRAAAKNHKYVTTVVDAKDYSKVIEELKLNAKVSLETNKIFALKVFQHTASYDTAISNYLNKEITNTLPEIFLSSFEKVQDLRYGENPHQKAAFYKEKKFEGISISNSTQLWGKELSYNNIIDLEAALNISLEYKYSKKPFVNIIKHTNPCGAALGNSVEEAYKRAVETDPKSYFGGIVGTNVEIDAPAAKEMSKSFLECIIAPSFSNEAFEILKVKKNIRLMTYDKSLITKDLGYNTRRVKGGLLVQEFDAIKFDFENTKTVSEKKVSDSEKENLEFAWKLVKHIKSNAIIYAKNGQLIGVGAGQMSRVDSSEVAVQKAKNAGLSLDGAVMASDAFFPFRDSIDAAAEAGIIAIIQPGGSVKDKEIIQAANEHEMAMVFTGKRHFNH
jgi:phosphoribosylaminoimidazolecarboxamide formyltransferase/IMP cyclohydrolase